MRRSNWPLSWAGSVRSRQGLPSRGASRQCLRIFTRIWRNRDEWALAEVEQGVLLAAQQLQLAGDVQAAVLALQAADARLVSNCIG